ncbi:MAG: hypothetical protein WC216_06510 [Gallionella sp.]|jgi:hypothetical protein
MLTLPLDPTDDRADPIFKDAAGCGQWLAQLQLTNLQLAQGRLLAQINELNRYPMRALERLNTLELLRETVEHLQGELAKKLADKPLPLNENEFNTFQLIVQLWTAMATGYQRCLQAQISGEITGYGALLCQRCLNYSGLVILEYQRTGYELSPELWRRLHELYAHAEEQDLHQTEVADPVNNFSTSCTACYAKTLLACYANPAQMTRWQFLHMDRWLTTWSNATTLDDSYSKSRNDAQPLAIDLSGSRGLQPTEGLPHHHALRYLAMVPISKLLRVKTILLQQGQTPSQAGLGEHSDTGACLELLAFLHQIWCENRHKRTTARRPSTLTTELCCKPDTIYAHLTGTPFKDSGIGELAIKQIQTLGYAQAGKNLAEMGYPLEKWRIQNESIMGAGLSRIDDTGASLRCRQLIAHRPENSPYFMLGTIAWARVSQNGKLQTGVRYLPGRAVAVRIHVLSINPSVSTIYAPAFVLPELPSIKTPASLIVPRDWFEARRVIEIAYPNDEVQTVKMGFSVERGLDYERISFTTL